MLIVPYSVNWIKDFEEIKGRLLSQLHGLCVKVEHIGSTSVPGLAAKPIIDIDIIYNDASDFKSIKNSLQTFGYNHNGNQDVEGREVFKRNGKKEDDILDRITHHLYVCQFDCAELHRHILFRDYLRKYENARRFYQNLKFEIAKEAKDDRKEYANIKEVKANSFINYIIELSKIEHKTFDRIEC